MPVRNGRRRTRRKGERKKDEEKKRKKNIYNYIKTRLGTTHARAPNGGTRCRRTLQRVRRYLRDSDILQRWTKLPPVFTEPLQNIGCYQTDRLAVTLTSPLVQPKTLPDVSQLRRNQGQFCRNKVDVIDAVYVCGFKRVSRNQGQFCRNKVDVIDAQSTFATSNVSAETRGSFVATKQLVWPSGKALGW